MKQGQGPQPRFNPKQREAVKTASLPFRIRTVAGFQADVHTEGERRLALAQLSRQRTLGGVWIDPKFLSMPELKRSFK